MTDYWGIVPPEAEEPTGENPRYGPGNPDWEYDRYTELDADFFPYESRPTDTEGGDKMQYQLINRHTKTSSTFKTKADALDALERVRTAYPELWYEIVPLEVPEDGYVRGHAEYVEGHRIKRAKPEDLTASAIGSALDRLARVERALRILAEHPESPHSAAQKALAALDD